MSVISAQITLGKRIAEETQLQAEEKWILEAINKIKTQRNCLQIERLQLESMKSQLRRKSSRNIAEEIKSVSPMKAPTTFLLSMAAPKPPVETGEPTAVAGIDAVVLSTPNRKLLEAEASCNTEELQLGVKNIFSQHTHPYVEEFEEEDEEENNGDDLLLDMNMFMNCTQQQ